VQSALYKTSEPQELDSILTAVQSVWRVADRRQWTAVSDGDLAGELRTVKGISKVLCSRPVSVL